jgi:hypothetical protein
VDEDWEASMMFVVNVAVVVVAVVVDPLKT